MISLIILTVTSFAQAQSLKTNLYRLPPEPAEAIPVATKPRNRKSGKVTEQAMSADGNLPSVYSQLVRSQVVLTDSGTIVPPIQSKSVFNGIAIGEVLRAQLLESVIAYSDSKSPVRAVLVEGKFKGAVLVGEASLDKNSKRVVIHFHKLRIKDAKTAFDFKAVALDEAGFLGLQGRIHSGEIKYFGAEFLAAAAAGYVDATVERTTTPFGQVQDSPSASNAGKKAVGAALSRTADRFAEKVRAETEYVTIDGPLGIRLLVQDQP